MIEEMCGGVSILRRQREPVDPKHKRRGGRMGRSPYNVWR